MQEAREKIIRYYKGTEGEASAVKLVDFAAQAVKSRKCKLTGFLSPFEQEMAGVIANSLGELNVDFYGGYRGAERQRRGEQCEHRGTVQRCAEEQGYGEEDVFVKELIIMNNKRKEKRI